MCTHTKALQQQQRQKTQINAKMTNKGVEEVPATPLGTLKDPKVNAACNADIAVSEKAVFDVICRALKFYKPDELMLAFNGGKDCTVLLHIVHKFYQGNACLRHLRLPVLYIRSEDVFDEIEDFVKCCESRYQIDMIVREGCMRKTLTQFCTENPNIKAVFMGSRRTDPHCANLQLMQVSDPGWPPLMLVNPIINWKYRDIWNYIFEHEVPYCILYDQGYTSIDSKKNTQRNPFLREIDPATGKIIQYLPAHKLEDEDGTKERAGRIVLEKD